MSKVRLQRWFEAAKMGDVATLQAALARGMDADATNAIGWTALHYAASLGRLDVVSTLIDAGANVNAPDCDGWTPLHVAAWHNHAEAMNLLLSAGAEVNVATRDARIALHLAAKYERAGAVTTLVRAGADVEARDANSETPRDVIGSRQFRETFDRIVAETQAERVCATARVRKVRRPPRPRL